MQRSQGVADLVDVDVMTADSAREALYRRDRERLVRLAYLLTGSQAVAEELVQEAFLATWDRLSFVASPGGYVRQSVVNLARRHHRRAEVEQRHAPRPPGAHLDPEVDETWQALWRLPSRQRTALVLRYYEDLDLAAIASTMGCRLGTAKSLVHRGLASLRSILEAQ